MMDFSWDLICGQAEGRELRFRQKDFSVIAHEPRFQIVKARSSFERSIFINAHAPHSGHSDDGVALFWPQVAAAIPQRYRGWPIVLLAGANARVGGWPTETVGDWQKEAP